MDAAVHQFLPTFAGRDAIGAHSVLVREVLRGMGLVSEIYADDIHPERAGDARHYETYRPGRRHGPAWLLYQASTGSRVADYLIRRPEPKLLNYHNIAPVQAFARWEPAVADELAEGRRQLGLLASVTHHAIAVSGYNEAELTEAGYKSTSVAPFLLDPGAFDHELDGPTLAWLDRMRDRGGANLLFVGRVSPHKAQHDLIKALAVYRRLYDPKARLHLVGTAASNAYVEALRRFAGHVGVRQAVNFAGSVPEEVKSAYYEGADAFLCLSDHEGFCVPLLEAMHHRLPVVAYGAAAVPETLGDAGVLLASKSPLAVAAALHMIIDDERLRADLVRRGTWRLAELSLDRTKPAFASAVERAISQGPP